MLKDIRNKGNVQLKPYQESMGITIEKCKDAGLSFRILFRTPSGKTCQLKLASVDKKLKGNRNVILSFEFTFSFFFLNLFSCQMPSNAK